MAEFRRNSAILPNQEPPPDAIVNLELEEDGRQNGRVANELCHTKRRVNADESARIT